MALFKIEKGTAANLTTNRPNAVEGYAYFTTDDGRFYIDITGGTTENPVPAVVGTNRIPLSADRADRIPYAENAQNSTYYNKTITTSDPFVLKDGSLIVIKFTADAPGGVTQHDPDNAITFNINGTGARPVYWRGARIPNEFLVQDQLYIFRAQAFEVTENNETTIHYRYEMVGDVIPVFDGDETVITDHYGRLTTRPFVDSYRIVSSLPAEGAEDTNIVYLVPTGESGAGGGGSGSGGGAGLTYALSRNNKNVVLTASNNTSTSVEALNETQVQALIDATITTALSTAYPTT